MSRWPASGTELSKRWIPGSSSISLWTTEQSLRCECRCSRLAWATRGQCICDRHGDDVARNLTRILNARCELSSDDQTITIWSQDGVSWLVGSVWSGDTWAPSFLQHRHIADVCVEPSCSRYFSLSPSCPAFSVRTRCPVTSRGATRREQESALHTITRA